jgi:hypothetical protein
MMNFEKMMSDLMGGLDQNAENPEGSNAEEGMPDFSMFAKILG